MKHADVAKTQSVARAEHGPISQRPLSRHQPEIAPNENFFTHGVDLKSPRPRRA
jgi:hypothetical protein